MDVRILRACVVGACQITVGSVQGSILDLKEGVGQLKVDERWE